jgi:hypothetical protein
MKLITEQIFDNLSVLKEEQEGKDKSLIITGVFMQAGTPNKNNRVYPLEIMKREVENYNKDYIQKNRGLGELGHPDNPVVNLERVSHMVKELRMDGKDVIGKAKLMDTPLGKIAKSLLKEGVKLGVSSRGLGSLRENNNGIKEVQEDFQLNAIDIVADPSAPDAFVEGVMEGREWVYENGVIQAKEVEDYKKQLLKVKKNKLESQILAVFEDFLKKL